MSLDFDSAALQMQQEDEEYDQEDYAREQELQQLLTGLPHDMLEDSGDPLSDYSAPEDNEQDHEPWDQEATQWDDRPIATNPQSDYGEGQDVYAECFLYNRGNLQGEMDASDWPDRHNEGEDKSAFEISGRASDVGSDDMSLGGDRSKAPGHYQQTNVYHLPEDFIPYTNGHQQEFGNLHGKRTNGAETKKEHLKLPFGASEPTSNLPVEPYKVIYQPYQNNIQQPVVLSPDAGRRNEAFEEMQQEFLGTGGGSPENMQILQLQVLNKAKGRKLEELNVQLEEKAQQIRYLSHQLAIVKDEKDGMCLSLQESQKLLQNGKEKEVQLEGQIKVLETQIQTLTANEEQLIKQSQVAEVARETLQQQLLELRRSDALQRAREQHEAVTATLKQKYEEQALSLQQKLDATHVTLQEQTELCCHLTEHVKQLERMLEESKVEKNEIISRLSRSLEESQNQCASLLQTGLVNETNQLRLRLQQAQSAQLISEEKNKALQEELKELKEEIAVYESAEKYGVFLNGVDGESNVEMTDSYVDLGIKKASKRTGLHSSSVTNKEADRGLSKDEIILDLKKEMERLLSSNTAKRHRVSQLQKDLDSCHETIEELKQQLVEMSVKELKGKTMELLSSMVPSETAEEIFKLKKENENLQQDIESYNVRIQELTENQEKLKHANQELCSQMRQMVQDSDRDKQEALDRCERTYGQHYEEAKRKLCEELEERQAKEREKLVCAYEENITQLKADLEELNKEMIAVKECYISVCRERDEQEATLKAAFRKEEQLKEEKFKKQLLEEKEESLKKLRAELEEEFQRAMGLARSRWQEEREAALKQHTEKEVARVNAFWEKELKETKDRTVQQVEKEWQSRLDHALEGAKRDIAELKDSCNQTEPLSLKDSFLSQLISGAVDEQTRLFQEALEEKEKTLREQEAKHHEKIAIQVESALTKARARWLRELTELEEYKAHLKAAKETWEKESEGATLKQVSLALSAAEEKWKKEVESSEKLRARAKELEENAFSLKRELDLKEEEIPAIVKAELAKARTQWNKEKHEEVLRLQEQNEKDYHSFLHEHRNKINEVLAKAKEDFAKQKAELLEEKEAELRACLSRRQQEWAAQEAKRLHSEMARHEDWILAQVELLLADTHQDLVQMASSEQAWPSEWNTSTPVQSSLPFKEKLAFCLQKAYKSTVSAVLEKAKQRWKEKHEDLAYTFRKSEDSRLPSGEGETGDQARPFLYDVGQQIELERRLRKQPPSQETEMDSDAKGKTRSQWFQEGVCCCERCHQQLERKEQECQDLRKKLDKACKHLQLAVKEQQTRHLQENGKIEESLTEDDSSMKNKLDDLKSSNFPPRSSSEGCVSKPCTACDGKALEEMRSQYIKAVGKIKSDMLRYIQDSKERAAEIIKAEVLRERQETARKMRKYYLICLQQLLMDDGKHEGAEKKIISAAGKIATMAKILETPVRNVTHTKTSHSVPAQNTQPVSEVEEPKRNYGQHPQQVPTESQTQGESSSSTAGRPPAHRRLPWSLKQELDAESQPASISQGQAGRRALKPLGISSCPPGPMAALTADGGANRGRPPASASWNPPSCASQARLQDVLPTSCTADEPDSGAAGLRFQNPCEKVALGELDRVPSLKHPRPTSEKVQEPGILDPPVRDEGSSLGCPLRQEASLGPSAAQARSSRQVPLASHFSHAGDSASGFCRQPGGPQESSPAARRKDPNFKESHPATYPTGVPYLNLDPLSPSDAHLSGALFCSSAGRSHRLLHSRKELRDGTAFHQDSGFDSPQIHFD